MAKDGQFSTDDISAIADGRGRANSDAGLFRAKSAFVDVEKRQVRVLASNDTLDRDGERILPSAFTESLKVYRQNPVILAGHQHTTDNGTSPVVGRAVRVWVDKRGLWAVIEFAQTELGEEYWQLYRDGFMKAVSVGFRVKEFEERSEIIDGQRRLVRVITSAELYEISCVSVPANPEALVKSQSSKPKRNFVAEKIEQRYREICLADVQEEYDAGLISKQQYDSWMDGSKIDDYAEVVLGYKDCDFCGNNETGDSCEPDYASSVCY